MKNVISYVKKYLFIIAFAMGFLSGMYAMKEYVLYQKTLIEKISNFDSKMPEKDIVDPDI